MLVAQELPLLDVKGHLMTTSVKALSVALFFIVPACGAYAQTGSSITADLAKKCREEAAKAHPTPKAGTKASGAEKAQRDAFQACITKGSSNNKEKK
jgi:hypothetical protein